MLQNTGNNILARRYTGDDLRNIVRSITHEKRKVEALQKFGEKECPEVGEKGYPEVGETYSVTDNWHEFWSFFKVVLIPNDDVQYYGGKEVKVLKVDGDLVRVSFTNTKFNDGWLPTQVLRNKFGEALKSEDHKIDSDEDELAQQKIKSKNLSLSNDNMDLQNELITERERNTKLMQEIKVVKERVAVLEERYEHGVKENRNLETQFGFVNERNLALETENERLHDKIDMFRKTTVKRDIESLPKIIENCTINCLTNATITIQKQIKIRKEEERQQAKRLENQIEHQRNQHLCQICMDRPRDHMFRPCFHMCACERCARRIAGDHGSCPICRGNIESILPVYNV